MNSSEWATFAQRAPVSGADSLALAVQVQPLVHLNAALNLLATLLLGLALWQIKQRREAAHGRSMLAALAVSTAFLTSYLIYHSQVGSVRFTHSGIVVRMLYYAVLTSHILLAFTIPFVVLPAALFGVKSLGWAGAAALSSRERARFRAKHLRIVRWAYPIWLYVSITGVLVYVMLYFVWPPELQ